MDLSNDLISKFVKATNDTKKQKSGTTVYGTIVEYGDSLYVQIDGSDQYTPISSLDKDGNSMYSSSTDIAVGDRVMITIKDHSATVTGNMSSPATSRDTVTGIVNDKVGEFESVNTGDLTAINGRIENLEAKDVDIEGRLDATEGNFETLNSDYADFKQATIDDLKVKDGEFDSLSSDYAEFKNATAENFKATNADIYNLESTYFTAVDAKIKDLETKKLDTESAEIKYANIDFTNIGEAAIETLYAKSGLIEDVTIKDGTITGNLVGVTIKGDLIEGGTIVADKLVMKGEDGLYYKLNTTGVTDSSFADSYTRGDEIEAVEGDLHRILEKIYEKSPDVIDGETIAGVEMSTLDGVHTDTNEQVYSYTDQNGDTVYCCSQPAEEDEVDIWYAVVISYVETNSYMDPVEGRTAVDGAVTITGKQVYIYTDSNDESVYYCLLDKPVDDAYTTTGSQVYVYLDPGGGKHFYCIDNRVYYRVDFVEDVYTKTEEVISPVNGIAVEGVTTDTGEQIYSYVGADSEEHFYCIVEGENVYYSLYVDADAIKLEQTDYNSLNGSVITAKSITATQIDVKDLVAFDAKIGGFEITDNSISSLVKDSADNTTRGIYLDNDGQFNVGDANNYIRYLREVTPVYEETDEVIEAADGTQLPDVLTDGNHVVYVYDISETEKGYYYVDGESCYAVTYKENVNYKLSISAESILYALNGSNRSVADLALIGEYVRISVHNGEPCIELGELDSDFRLIITNTRILFKDEDDTPAYITNKALHIKRAIIEEEMSFGQFVWKIRGNGNMGLVWQDYILEEVTE